uniref:N-acetylmuramoyl-L-alanine amidase n=1 Tax=Silanimonas lenta TaxID=265429 RepID=UPI002FE05993
MSRAVSLNWTRWLHLAVLLAGLAYAAFGQAATTLGQVRLSASDEATRAELQLDAAPGPFKVFSLGNPDRLVLDLPAARLAEGFRPPAPNGRVIGVRTGYPEPGTLRVVFDLGGAVKPRARVEGAGRETRLVLELFRDEGALVAAAPVLAAPAAAAQTAPAAPAGVPAALQGERKLVIAIDAGHGGRDPGAIGSRGTYEKTVTLQVARALAEEVDRHPGMRAVLIRDSDVFIPLGERYRKAREAQADLFISVHADAAHNRAANGASVFVLSTRGASSEAARFLADRENNSDLVGGVS